MGMSAQQVQAELQRKKNLGIAPTNAANTTTYNALTPKSAAPKPVTGVAPSATKPSIPMPKATPVTTAPKSVSTPMAANKTTPMPLWRQAAESFTPAPTPPQPAQPPGFNYDPKSDPVYQAALASARANAQNAGGDAMADLNKRGILDSTITSDRVAGISADAVSQVDSNLLPQLSQQAYQRFQDDRTRQDSLKYQDDQLAIQKGQLTGVYDSPEMQSLYDEVLQAKQDYANATTPEARDAAHQRAEVARSKLTGLNANAGLVGSDVALGAAQGNQSKFGVQTQASKEFDQTMKYNKDGQQFDQGMQTKQFDFTKQQTAWDNNFKSNQFSWQKAQQTWENAFQEKNFDQSMKDAAASRGLQWANLNQQQQQFIADQAFREKSFEADQGWKQKDYELQSGKTNGTAKMQEESKGMIDALRSGQLTPTQASQQIDEDLKLGFYTADEANYLKNQLGEVSSSQPKQPITPTMQESIDSLPSDKQLEKLWQTEGKPKNIGLTDYKDWYRSPEGKLSGVDFNTWKRLYGPQLTGG